MTKTYRMKYAVICREHGSVELTEEQYEAQMLEPDACWFCPQCGGRALWDDDVYEQWLEDNGDPDIVDAVGGQHDEG